MSKLQLLEQAAATYTSILNDPEEVDYFTRFQIESITEEVERNQPLDYRHEVHLVGSMAIHGTWRGMLGVVKIEKGDCDGWDDIRHSFLYRAWEVRTKIASGDRAGRIRGLGLRDRIAETFGHAVSLGDLAFAQWCGERVLRSFKTKEGAFKHDDDSPFEPFLFQLYALWQGDSFQLFRRRGCQIGPYEGIVKNWNADDDQFASALQSACDYHCDPNGFGTYGNVPYVHVPVEILSALRIRQFLGLGTPAFSHPLLETPFAKVPEVGNRPLDPILVAAIGKIREAHPEIGDPW